MNDPAGEKEKKKGEKEKCVCGKCGKSTKTELKISVNHSKQSPIYSSISPGKTKVSKPKHYCKKPKLNTKVINRRSPCDNEKRKKERKERSEKEKGKSAIKSK